MPHHFLSDRGSYRPTPPAVFDEHHDCDFGLIRGSETTKPGMILKVGRDGVALSFLSLDDLGGAGLPRHIEPFHAGPGPRPTWQIDGSP